MIWSGRLEKNRNTFRSSPIYADGRLYVARMDGTVFVVDADADEFRVLSKNVIANETTLATPVLFDGKVLLRTEDHLYLIAN